MLSILLTLLGAFVFTEIVGYFIHIVLHSQKIEFLSRGHMIHHMKIYGADMPQRPNSQYRDSTENRWSILGVGLEWLIPIFTIIALVFGVAHYFELYSIHFFVFISGSLAWGYFLFGYMHSSMHLKDFWMLKVPYLKDWYLKIRKYHDIHHLHISDDGKMNVNYGICFFIFDRLFGSFKPSFSKFNKKGYEVSKEKYSFIYNDNE